jgi:hypothetical protein
MDWKKWNSAMQLDSITYFQFLFPAKGMFTYAFPVNDPFMGYISPYVIKNGNIQPVYSINANNKLIYSHYTNVEIPYIFAVPEGKINLRIRIPKAEIVADNLYIEPGRKYIMSFINDTSNHYVRIIKKPYLPDKYESNRTKNSLMIVNKNNNYSFTYIIQDNKIFPTKEDQRHYSPYTVVGPLDQSNYRFEAPGEFSIEEKFEPGYRYSFKKGVVKMHSIKQNEIYSYSNPLIPPTQFSESALTEKTWLRLWQNDLAQKQAKSRIYNNPDKTTAGFGRMKFFVPLNKTKFLKNVILFQYNTPDFIRVYGNSDLFHQLEPGIYRAVLIDNNNAYLEADSLIITANGMTTFQLGANWKAADAITEKINQIIQNQSSGSSLTHIDRKNSWQSVNEAYMWQNNITLKGENVIEGIIKDNTTGEPLIGVNIMAEGTTIGTISDINGYYQLDVPPGTGALVFSYIGYMSERVPIGLSRIINATLQADIKNLEEVVVVGYGIAKKINFTAASVSTVQIRGINTLSGRAAGVNVSAIYGSRAPEIIESKGTLSERALHDNEFMSSMNSAASLRSNFSDYAFWQPALVTDKNGEATFEVTFPDDITAWKTFYVAMGRKKGGSLQSKISAFKPIAASLAVPRFLIEGDSSVVIGKTVNYGKDTIKATSLFKIENEIYSENNFSLINSHIDRFSIRASNKDSLSVTYQITPEKGNGDGEKRSIPIYKKGTLETKGIFKTVEKDSAFRFIVPTNYSEADLHLDADPLNIIRREIQYVHNYGYLCNEQAASKLKSLLAEKSICNYLNQRFSSNSTIKRLINRLESSRNFENLWGWWKDSEESVWISLHVMEALLQAEKAGYEIKIPRETIQQYLLSRYPAYSAKDKIKVLKILIQINADNNIKFDAETILKSGKLDFATRLETIELLQKAGNKVELDSLLKQKQETMFGNYYWGVDSFYASDNYILTTLNVYRIFRNDSNYSEYLPKIRNFFLEERKNGYWRNTYESAKIIETILPDMLRDKKQLTNPSAFININGNSLKVDSFPYHNNLNGGDTVKLITSGDFPVYATIFKKRWNSKPLITSHGFRVNSYFEDHTSTIKAGTPIKLFTEIHVLRRASYVMVEIPIPAGCSYEEKHQRNKWEVHREYFKDKVCIFYNDLPIGDYMAEIVLLPRFGGKYTLNPVKVEMMYFPVFYGRNEIKNVIVN